MELRFKATHKFARVSPKKARYVMDMIRHKPVNEALTILRFSNRRAATFIDKVLRSALANAGEESLKKKLNIDADKLVVGEAFADEAPTYRRWRPRSRGMANPILKKNSHINIVLTPIDESAITKFEEKGEKKRKKKEAEAAASKDEDAATATATAEADEEAKAGADETKADTADEATADASEDTGADTDSDETSDETSDDDDAEKKEDKE